MKILTRERAIEKLLRGDNVWANSGEHELSYNERNSAFSRGRINPDMDDELINHIDDFSANGVPLMTEINLYDTLDEDIDNAIDYDYFFEESKFSYYISKKVNFQKIIAAINDQDYSVLADMDEKYFVMAEKSSKMEEDFYEVSPITAAKMVKQGVEFGEFNKDAQTRERMLLNLGQYLSNDWSELPDILDSLLNYHGDDNVSVDEINENIILYQPFKNWNYSELINAL